MNDQPLDHDEGLFPTDLNELILILWDRKSLLALGLAVAAILGALYYAQATPVYESSAEVLIVSKRPDVGAGNQSFQLEDYLSTHTVLVQSPLIIERSIRASNLASLRTFQEGDEDLAMAIADKLTVDRGSKDLGSGADNILTLLFQGPEPDECQTVVQAIVDSYREFLTETYRDMGEDTVQLFTTASETLRTDLLKQEEEYREFRKASPIISRGEQEANPLLDRLSAIESELSALLLQKTSLESALQITERARKEIVNPNELLAMVSDLASKTGKYSSDVDGGGLDMNREAYTLLQEKQRIRQKYGPQHPFTRSVQRRIDSTREFLGLPSSAYAGALSDDNETGGTDGRVPAEVYTEYWKQELERIDLTAQLLRELYDQEYAAAKQLALYQLQDEELSRNLQRTQGLYDGVVTQLQSASLTKDYDGFEARVISPPRIGEKVSPSIRSVGAKSLLLGLLGGTGLVVLAEFRDKKLRSADEIRRQFGYPIVGYIPRFKTLQEKGDIGPAASLCVFRDPQGPAAEAFRSARTSLFFSTHGGAQKVIQLTSACPGDGKSTVTANLAISVAQSGKRVLLVDADLRRPQQHHLFAIPATPGLSGVLGLGLNLSSAISSCCVENLWILPSGDIPSDPSELVTSQAFADVLHTVRGQYDYVFVDTGPLLAISDPAAIAAHTDGLMIACQLSKNNRRQLTEVQEIIKRIHTKVLGVILNRVESRSKSGYGGYGYGRYEYVKEKSA